MVRIKLQDEQVTAGKMIDHLQSGIHSMLTDLGKRMTEWWEEAKKLYPEGINKAGVYFDHKTNELVFPWAEPENKKPE